MGKIIQFNDYRANVSTIETDQAVLSQKDAFKVEQIRDSIEVALEDVAAKENMPFNFDRALLPYRWRSLNKTSVSEWCVTKLSPRFSSCSRNWKALNISPLKTKIAFDLVSLDLLRKLLMCFTQAEQNAILNIRDKFKSGWTVVSAYGSCVSLDLSNG